MTKPEQRVVCAAHRHRETGNVITGVRHFDNFIRQQIAIRGDSHVEWHEQGFVDQFGQFLTREEALALATKNGQIYRRCGGDEKRLYSENLY